MPMPVLFGRLVVSNPLKPKPDEIGSGHQRDHL